MYRYGDATPFPLEENFIETVQAATDACVALFRADHDAVERRHKADAAGQEARAELERLGLVARAIEGALRPVLAGARPATPTQQSAVKIAQSAAAVLDRARLGVEKRRDAVQREMLEASVDERIGAAVGELLLRHQLPGTTWSVHWLWSCATGTATCTLQSQTAGAELDAEYRAQPAAGSRWAEAVRVADLEPALAIELQRETGWLRKHPRLRAEPLDRMWITQVDVTPQRASFVLRRHARKPSPGFLISMRAEDQSMPTLSRVAVDGKVEGRALIMGGESGQALARLWRHIDEAMDELRDQRSALVGATQAGQPIERASSPRRVGEAIIDTLAPLIREMRLRSRVHGELILKRDAGDGRREELFLPRSDLESRFADLPDSYRRYFEAVGLANDATLEFVGRAFPLRKTRPDSEAVTTDRGAA
ncbi:MAG TPA: hypothetical protein VL172_07285 [Kofleriaceae bacterium]|jgi:hypothetical protein|nr:hypothetical protein [Kofleriaceae bacterium]